MGNGPSSDASVELEWSQDDAPPETAFEGTLVVKNEGPAALELKSPPRVTLQYRAKIVEEKNVIQGAWNIQEVWKVGGPVTDSRSISPGETRFDFSFSMHETKQLQEERANKEYWKKRFGGADVRSVQYDYVVRAGSPPQLKDLVVHPYGTKQQLEANNNHTDTGLWAQTLALVSPLWPQSRSATADAKAGH